MLLSGLLFFCNPCSLKSVFVFVFFSMTSTPKSWLQIYNMGQFNCSAHGHNRFICWFYYPSVLSQVWRFLGVDKPLNLCCRDTEKMTRSQRNVSPTIWRIPVVTERKRSRPKCESTDVLRNLRNLGASDLPVLPVSLVIAGFFFLFQLLQVFVCCCLWHFLSYLLSHLLSL